MMTDYVRSHVLSAMNITTIVFWDMLPCSPVESYQYFERKLRSIFLYPEDGGIRSHLIVLPKDISGFDEYVATIFSVEAFSPLRWR